MQDIPVQGMLEFCLFHNTDNCSLAIHAPTHYLVLLLCMLSDWKLDNFHAYIQQLPRIFVWEEEGREREREIAREREN